jgi:anti-anti-sigma regulatory factor
VARPLPLHQTMLRITEVVDSGSETTLHVEGRIVSEWVSVLQEECSRLLQESGRRLRLDLGAVTFIDLRGVLALRRLTTKGVAIVNSQAFIDALLKGDGKSWAP